VLLVLPLLPGCRRDAAAEGTALRTPYATIVDIAPIRIGSRIGSLDVSMTNDSDLRLTMKRLEIRGPGVGSVVRVAGVEAAPKSGDVDTTPGGLYTSDPPVARFAGECHVQRLEPFGGYILEPGASMRAWIVFEATAPGDWSVKSQTVTYEVVGADFTQVIPIGYQGSVSNTSRFPVFDPDAACMRFAEPLG